MWQIACSAPVYTRHEKPRGAERSSQQTRCLSLRMKEDPHLVLCAEETLATGRRVVFAYRSDGAPIACWDASTLPASWTRHAAWHAARVVMGAWDEAVGSLPTLHESSEDVVSGWLANTYAYLMPLLGARGCTFSSAHLFHDQIIENLRHLCRASHVLEIGGSAAVEAICRTTGCSGAAVDPAYEQSVQQTTRIDFLKATAESLPVCDGEFDAVVSLFVLEHLVNPRRAMSEMARVLRPGGILLLAIPVTDARDGSPPLFHRWQFVFAGPVGARQTLQFSELVAAATGVDLLVKALQPIARESDACLFAFGKRYRG